MPASRKGRALAVRVDRPTLEHKRRVLGTVARAQKSTEEHTVNSMADAWHSLLIPFLVRILKIICPVQ